MHRHTCSIVYIVCSTTCMQYSVEASQISLSKTVGLQASGSCVQIVALESDGEEAPHKSPVRPAMGNECGTAAHRPFLWSGGGAPLRLRAARLAARLGTVCLQ